MALVPEAEPLVETVSGIVREHVEAGRYPALGALAKQVLHNRAAHAASLELRIDLDPAQYRRIGLPLDVQGSDDLAVHHHGLGSPGAQPFTVLLSGEVLGPGTKRLCQVIAHRLAMDAEQDVGVAWRSRRRVCPGRASSCRRKLSSTRASSGRAPGSPNPAIATVLAAAGDGLLLHALLDPGLDVGAGIEALRAILRAHEA